MAIPVAHTIYYEMGPERRAEMGIDDSLVRFSIGIEESEDLIADFERALAKQFSVIFFSIFRFCKTA